MVDIYESFEKLGLTRNEVTIYKYLLRKGISTGAQIWVENSLDKSSAYRAIGQLQEKRLIYAIGETRNQKFAAYPVEALKELHRKVEESLTSVSGDIEKFVKDINEYAKENYKSSRIQLYEGVEGYKLFAKLRLEGHVTLIRQIGPAETILEGYDETIKPFIQDFINERVKREIPIHLLFDQSTIKPIAPVSDAKQFKEVRVFPKLMNLTSTAATYGDITAFYTQEDGKFMGLVLKDRFVTQLFTTMYDIIWDMAKNV